MNYFKLQFGILLCCLAISSCQDDVDIPKQNEAKNFSYENAISTRTASYIDGDEGLYNLTTDWDYYENIYIPQESIEKLENVVALNSPTLGKYIGCHRYTNVGKTYKLSITKCPYIASGIYVVQDCDAYLDIFFPNAPLVVLAQSSPNCGYHPDDTSFRGYKVEGYNSSTGKWTFKTRMIRVISHVLGQSVNSSYPVKMNDLEWNYAYYSGIY